MRRLTLTINDTSFDDDGLYECSAGNVYGNTTTSINITVHGKSQMIITSSSFISLILL